MRRHPLRWALAGLLLACLALGWSPARRHARAASLLADFSSDAVPHPAEVATASFRVGPVEVPARLYRMPGASAGPGIVLVHGVHHLGMDEPRLVRFAQTLAGAGFTVLTPQVAELADYRVDARSVETLGEAVRSLSRVLGAGAPALPRVGLMGLSFAGGLALLAASDPRYAPSVGFVVAVGAHDDLSRVSRFFALDVVERPDGTSQAMKAHPYGPLVLVYSHLPDFFDAGDVPAARDALRAWLWDDHTGAQTRAKALSPQGQARMELLLTDQLATLRPQLLGCIARDAAAMAAVSPAGHLAGLTAPALLLHGAGDTVIPASETSWLAQDVPRAALRMALVSPALQHVELQGEPGWRDKLALVHFVAELLAQASP